MGGKDIPVMISPGSRRAYYQPKRADKMNSGTSGTGSTNHMTGGLIE